MKNIYQGIKLFKKPRVVVLSTGINNFIDPWCFVVSFTDVIDEKSYLSFYKWTEAYDFLALNGGMFDFDDKQALVEFIFAKWEVMLTDKKAFESFIFDGITDIFIDRSSGELIDLVNLVWSKFFEKDFGVLNTNLYVSQ